MHQFIQYYYFPKSVKSIMCSASLKVFFLFLSMASTFDSCYGAIKFWLPDLDLHDPDNWIENTLPCPTQSLVFPNNMFAMLQFPEVYITSSFILSDNGGFFLHPNLELVLLNEANHEQIAELNLCEDRPYHYKKPIIELWMLSKNWGILNDNFTEVMPLNSAVPHAERIPCQYDVVAFSHNRSFVVDLQFAPSLSFREIRIADSTYLPTSLPSFFRTNVGQFVFPNNEETHMEIGRCSNTSQCECQETDIMGQLCQNEEKHCERPQCLHPIRPIGHCCDICGASIVMKLKATQKIDLSKLREQIIKQIHMNNFKEDTFDYHLSFIHNSIQMVIVDKFAYNGMSLEIMKVIQGAIFDRLFKGEIICKSKVIQSIIHFFCR